MILYYNVHAVSTILKKCPSDLEIFFSYDKTDELIDNYERFGLNRHNVIYDRTGALPHYLKMSKGLHPIPPRQSNYNRSFFEVAEQRAKELIDLDVPINVMWSGGIDSTFILFMLQKYAKDADQVRVYGTYNSVIESGDLFDRRISKEFKYNIKVAARNEYNFKEFDGVYVSGMCGNQLFGPTDDFFANGNTAMFHHTLGTAETIYEDYKTNIDPELLEFLDPVIKSSPRPIETVADLRWLCIFNLDWYTALYEHRTQLTKEVAENILGFFSTDDFQTWAVSTNEPFTLVKGDPNTHRWQMRSILSDVFGETHYAKHKQKQISSFSAIDPYWMFMLENYHNTYLKTLP
jgi:hypothetical protein